MKISVLDLGRVPRALRTYAFGCSEKHVKVNRFDGWRVYVEKKTLDTPLRGTAVYSLKELVLNKAQVVKWVVSETAITVNCELSEGMRLIAPKIRVNHPQKAKSLSFCCQTLLHAAPWAHVGLENPETQVYQCWAPEPAFVASQLRWRENGWTGKARLLDPLRKAVPDGGILTTEQFGFSLWHLLAVGMYDAASIEDFLNSTFTVEKNVIITDLKEFMTVFDKGFKTEPELLGFDGLTWEEFCEITAFRCPFELVLLTGKSFLESYTFDDSLLSPTLKAFRQQTVERLKARKDYEK